MTDIEILKNEMECVKRADAGCNRKCLECDLVLDSKDIIKTYENAIKLLQNIYKSDDNETILETVKNDAYQRSCRCPKCNNYIARCSYERIFYCDECGTKLHQREFTEEEVKKARFDREMDEYEDL
jgi:ribosomal protein L37AE/L43A